MYSASTLHNRQALVQIQIKSSKSEEFISRCVMSQSRLTDTTGGSPQPWHHWWRASTGPGSCRLLHLDHCALCPPPTHQYFIKLDVQDRQCFFLLILLDSKHVFKIVFRYNNIPGTLKSPQISLTPLWEVFILDNTDGMIVSGLDHGPYLFVWVASNVIL